MVITGAISTDYDNSGPREAQAQLDRCRNTQQDIYFKVYNDDIRIGRLVLLKSLVTFETLSPPFSC